MTTNSRALKNYYLLTILWYYHTVGPTSPQSNTGSDNSDDKNRNVLIGVLVPVILILLVVVTILTIGIVFVVKRYVSLTTD